MMNGQNSYFCGNTPSVAYSGDHRFSYCLYVPTRAADQSEPVKILVAVHDTLRNNQSLRDLFAEFAETSNTIILSPLFPGGVPIQGDLDCYKYLRCENVCFDEILIGMVDEVVQRYAVKKSTFSIFGFSGGAHFAHRFFYVHPERLQMAIVAAPGSVTLPSESFDWWAGVRDFQQVFGIPIKWNILRQVPIHLIVGADDVNPKGIIQSKDNPRWVVGADAAGSNRVERLRSLFTQLRALGASVSIEELAGVSHRIEPIVLAAVERLSNARRNALIAESLVAEKLFGA